jgi:cell division protein ZapA (FtsZ GTPase activity inhibitor)
MSAWCARWPPTSTSTCAILQKQTRAADTQSLAILTALQITEELWKERRGHAELKKRVRDKGRALLQFIEREGRV